MKKYGILKHVKTGQFVKIVLDFDVEYACAKINKFEATIMDNYEADDFLNDRKGNVFREFTYQTGTWQTCPNYDAKNEEFIFVECDIVLKD